MYNCFCGINLKRYGFVCLKIGSITTDDEVINLNHSGISCINQEFWRNFLFRKTIENKFIIIPLTDLE